MKAALALKDIIITTQHVVSADFVAAYPDFAEARRIGRLAASLEREGLKTEYPLFGRADLPIWIPSQQYQREDAVQALERAEEVFNTIVQFLEAQHHIPPPGTRRE